MAQREPEETVRTAQRTTTDPAILAAAASVGLSWYYFFVQGDRQRGIFVGLWPPTILAFASYFNQLRVREMMDRMTSMSGIRRSVQRMVQGNQ